MPLEQNIAALSPDEAVRIQEMEAEHLNQAVDGESSDAEEADRQAEQEHQKQLDMARGQMAKMDESFYEQLHRRRIDLTLRSLETIGDHLAGVAGRKNLVWISGGVPVLTYGARDRWMMNYEPQIRGLARRLATQNIAVYPVQASALRVGLLGTASVAEGTSRGQTEQLRPLTREQDQRLWATMDVLAEVTGGRAFKNTNDMSVGVSAAESDMRGSYSVGFYVDNNDDRWRDLKVQVRRPGVRLLHRQGYMALGPVKQPRDWTQDEWQAAVQNPLGSTAIRLDARVEAASGGLNVLLQIAADDLYYRRANDQPVTELEIGFAERTRQEWTRVRRDAATITLKESSEQRVRPTIVRRVRDFAHVAGATAIDRAVADKALLALEVDAAGMDAMDRRYLSTIALNYGGGPVGVETIAAALSEPRDAIEEIIEPFLIQQGFLQRTPRGRLLTGHAFRHLGLAEPARDTAQFGLFNSEDE
jgi:VWFA-related protein